MKHERLFVELGRLDGRLVNSQAKTTWQMQMRMRGIVNAAASAGIPISVDELESWISGRRCPPRSLEGINDPLSVAAVAYFADQAWSTQPAEPHTKEMQSERAFFNYSEQAIEWASEDVRFYIHLYRQLRDEVRQIKLHGSISEVANTCGRLLRELQSMCDSSVSPSVWEDTDRAVPLAWLVALHVPNLLVRYGLTSELHPNLVPSFRFTSYSKDEIEQKILDILRAETELSQSSLDAIEQRIVLIQKCRKLTGRSKAQHAARFMIAFPHLRMSLLAKAIDTTPQGAGHIRKSLDLPAVA